MSYEKIAGTLTDSAMSIHSDIIKPQYYKAMVDERPGQYKNNFMDLMKVFGNSINVSDDPWKVFFSGWKWDYITEKTGIAGGGTTATITASTDDHDSNGNCFVEIGMSIGFNDGTGRIIWGYVEDKVTTANNNTFSIRSFDDSITFPVVAAGTELMVSGVSAPYGSGQPNGYSSNEILREFGLEIFEASWSQEGHTITKPTWVKMISADGSKEGFFSKEVADTEWRMNKGVNMKYIWGIADSNTSLVSTAAQVTAWGGGRQGAAIPSTHGIWNWIYDLGYTDSTQPVGSENLSTLTSDLTNHLINQGLDSSAVLMIGGVNRINSISEKAMDKIQGNGSDFIRSLAMDRKAMGFDVRDGWDIMLDASVLTLNGVKIILVNSCDFNDPRSTGLDTYGFKDKAMVLPLGTSKVRDYKTGQSKIIPSFGEMILSNNGYNRGMETWVTGAAGGDFKYTNRIDVKTVDYRKHSGVFALNAHGGYLLV